MGDLEMLKLLSYARKQLLLLSLKHNIFFGGDAALATKQKQGFRRELLLIATGCLGAAEF
jgi:hypothetical protein